MTDYQRVEAEPRFGVFSGYAYSINSVIGAGFLSIPWAYQNGGWALSLAMQALFLASGWLLSCQLLEVTSRTTALSESDEKPESVTFCRAMKVAFGLSKPDDDVPSTPHPALREHLQFDLYEIVKLLMGKYWAAFYFLCNTVFLLGSLTAYVNIFGTGFGTHIPIFDTCTYSEDSISAECRWQYVVFISIFFVLMAYFSSIEFHEQRLMQVTMTVMRLFVISTVIVISTVDILWKRNIDNDKEYRGGNPSLVNFSMLGMTMPIVLFAGIYQPYFPGILNSIRKDPRTLSKILAFVTLTLWVFYSLLGLSTSFSIPNVPTNVSLSFAEFTNGHSHDTRPAWTYAIGYLIVLFPAIDVVSIFPLLAHAVSDNVLSVFYSADRSQMRRNAKVIYYGARIGCIIPAFVYGYFEVKLGPIVNNSGLICFYLTFFMIPLLHISARCVIAKPSQYQVSWNPLVLRT